MQPHRMSGHAVHSESSMAYQLKQRGHCVDFSVQGLPAHCFRSRVCADADGPCRLEAASACAQTIGSRICCPTPQLALGFVVVCHRLPVHLRVLDCLSLQAQIGRPAPCWSRSRWCHRTGPATGPCWKACWGTQLTLNLAELSWVDGQGRLHQRVGVGSTSWLSSRCAGGSALASDGIGMPVLLRQSLPMTRWRRSSTRPALGCRR